MMINNSNNCFKIMSNLIFYHEGRINPIYDSKFNNHENLEKNILTSAKV